MSNNEGNAKLAKLGLGPWQSDKAVATRQSAKNAEDALLSKVVAIVGPNAVITDVMRAIICAVAVELENHRVSINHAITSSTLYDDRGARPIESLLNDVRYPMDGRR